MKRADRCVVRDCRRRGVHVLMRRVDELGEQRAVRMCRDHYLDACDDPSYRERVLRIGEQLDLWGAVVNIIAVSDSMTVDVEQHEGRYYLRVTHNGEVAVSATFSDSESCSVAALAAAKAAIHWAEGVILTWR